MKKYLIFFLILFNFSCQFSKTKQEKGKETEIETEPNIKKKSFREKTINKEITLPGNKKGILKSKFIDDTLVAETFFAIDPNLGHEELYWHKNYTNGFLEYATFYQSDGRLNIRYHKNGAIKYFYYHRQQIIYGPLGKVLSWEPDGLIKEYDEEQYLIEESLSDFPNEYLQNADTKKGQLVSIKEYQQAGSEADQLANGKWRYYKLYSGSDSTKQGYYFVTKTETYKNDSLIKTEVHKNGLGEPRVKRHFYKD